MSVLCRNQLLQRVADGLAEQTGLEPDRLLAGEHAEAWARLVGCTVVTEYNNAAYRVQAVRRDLTARDSFLLSGAETSFVDFVRTRWGRNVRFRDQPLLQARPERRGETILLLPELCLLAGTPASSDPLRLADALRETRLEPRFLLGDALAEARRCQTDLLGLDEPLQVPYRRLDLVPSVVFTDRDFPIEDLDFFRWMRNGLLAPAALHRLLVLHPRSEAQVLPIWLRSLCDIARVAFTMTIGGCEPVEYAAAEDIVPALRRLATPDCSVIVIMSRRDALRQYAPVKRDLCTRLPCASQVVLCETIRKRKAIAASLCRICLQLNCKNGGALWRIRHRSQELADFLGTPTMVLGLAAAGGWLALVATLDRHASLNFTQARRAEEPLDASLVACLREFEAANGSLPQRLVLFAEGHCSRAVEAMGAVCPQVQTRGGAYAPQLVVVRVGRRHGARFFDTTEGTANLPVGSVLDDPRLVEGQCFFRVSTRSRATAVPTLYSVVHDAPGRTDRGDLVRLVGWLELMYYGSPQAIARPAQLQYALRAARQHAALGERVHPRLEGVLSYL